jgi:transcriptional regulator with XRE-family HTH domain
MQRSASPGIRLRAAQIRQVQADAGLLTDTALAEHLGISGATVSRLLKGSIVPGEATIAAILAAFPDYAFEDLFEVVSAA